MTAVASASTNIARPKRRDSPNSTHEKRSQEPCCTKAKHNGGIMVAQYSTTQDSSDSQTRAGTFRINKGEKKPRRTFQEICDEVFMLMSGGKRRSTSEIAKDQ